MPIFLKPSTPWHEAQVTLVAASAGGPLGNMLEHVENLLPPLTLPLITPKALLSAAPTVAFSDPVRGCLAPPFLITACLYASKDPAADGSTPLQACQVEALLSAGGPSANKLEQMSNMEPDLVLPPSTLNAFSNEPATAAFSLSLSGVVSPSPVRPPKLYGVSSTTADAETANTAMKADRILLGA